MTSAQEFFLEVAERALDIEIVLRDDHIMRVVGVGTVTFERESLPPSKVMNVLYVPRMKKNLISVSSMEEKGFDVTLSGGQVLMHPRGASITSTKVIGVHSGKLYKFSFQTVGAFVSSTYGLVQVMVPEDGAYAHVDFRVLREITTRVPDFSVEHYEVCRGCALGKNTKLPSQQTTANPQVY